MKKLISVLISAFIFTGCSGVEVSDRAFAQLLAIERNGSLYSVSMLLYGPDGKESDVISGSGATVSSALRSAGESSGQEVFIGHTQLIVLGGGTAGCLSELDDGVIPPSCPTAYSDKPSELIDGKNGDIIGIIDAHSRNGDFIRTAAAVLVSEKYCALPIIKASSDGISFENFTITDGSSFYGRTNSDSSAAARIITGDFHSGDSFFVSLSPDGYPVTARINSVSTKRSAFVEDGRLKVIISVSMDAECAENGLGVPKSKVKRALCEKIKNGVIEAYRSSVWQSGSDIFGIYRLTRRSCPDYAERCGGETEALKNSVLNVSVSAELE